MFLPLVVRLMGLIHSMLTRFHDRCWHPATPWRPEKFPFFYGWVIVFAATLGTVFSIPGQTMGFSVFTEILMKELQLSRVQLSVAYCLGTVLSGVMLPMIGRWMDRWGERKMSVLATVSSFLILLFLSEVVHVTQKVMLWIPGLGHTWVAFLTMTVGFFLIRLSAQGVLSMACRNAIGRWFDRNRGWAFSLSSLVVSFSFAVAPRWMNLLVESYGYQVAWQSIALATLVIMAPIAWACFRDAPEQSGLCMDGRLFSETKSVPMDMWIHQEMNLAQTLRSFSFWVFNLSFAFYAMFATAFTFHIVSMGDEFGFQSEAMIRLFLPMATVSVLTNLCFGWINPKVRLKGLLFVMNLGALAGVVGLYALNSESGVLAYVVGNGVAGGGFVCLSGIVWPRFFGRAHLGAISGVNMSTMVIASGLGPLIFGFSGQVLASYRPALLFSAVLPLFLAVGSLWADNPQRRWARAQATPTLD